MTIAHKAQRALVVAWLLCAACQSRPPAADPAAEPGQTGVLWHVEGNENFGESELNDYLDEMFVSLGGGAMNRARADDLAFALEVFYRKAGYPEVHVGYEVEGEPPRATASFVIEEGLLVHLERVNYEGNEQFSDEDLQAFLREDRPGWFAGGQALYVESQIEAGRVAIETHYVDAGYLDARARVRRLPSEDPSRARIVVEIQEGVRYRLSAVELVWPSGAPVLEEECHEFARTSVGEPYRIRQGYELRAKLRDLFGNKGHPEAKVEVTRSLDPDTGSVALKIEIEPGPAVSVSEIRFDGELDTNEDFLLSRVRVETGVPYDQSRVEKGVRRLYGTGLFKEVQSRLEGTGAERTLVFDLKESPSREVFVEPGFGSYELLRLRLGVRERNIWGTGRQLRAETSLAVRAQNVKLVLSDPWFLGSDYSADLVAEYTRREEPSFTQKGPGIGLTLSRQITPRLSRSVGYQLRQSSSEDVDVTDDVNDDDVLLSSLRVSQRYDSRDNFFVPRKGFFIETSLEYGGSVLGSELDYLRSTLNSSTYRSLSPRNTLALAFRTGVIVPVGDDASIPIQERFFNGGENSVRSFKESKLGPLDSGDDPVGGEAFSTLNLELRHALTAKWEGAFFVDLGNVTPKAGDYFEFGGIEAGIGVGIRYLLPVGPIRLDVGVNPDPGEADKDYAIHVALGIGF